MSPSTFQQDLFGPDASLSGWPTDGHDLLDAVPSTKGEPSTAELRTGAKDGPAARVMLGEAPEHPAGENARRDDADPRERQADRDAAPAAWPQA